MRKESYKKGAFVISLWFLYGINAGLWMIDRQLHWGVFFWPREKRPVGDRRLARKYYIDKKGSLAYPGLDIRVDG